MTVKIEHSSDSTFVVDCVRRWGGSASDAALDPNCKIFTSESSDGLISYREEGRCCIVYGDPICSKGDLPILTKAFHEYCSKNKKSIIYVTASKEFLDVAIQTGCHAYMEFGEELVIDPHDDPLKKQGEHACVVRRKVKRAKKEGITIHEYLPEKSYEGFSEQLHENLGDSSGSETSALKQQIENVSVQWLTNRKGPQVHTTNVFLFENSQGKRWWYASQNGTMVGIAVLNRLEAHQGWLLNHVMVLPNAPQGTPEFLITSILEHLQSEGCHYVAFGAVPSQQLGEIKGFGKASTWLARHAYNFISNMFHLKGLKKFWEKYDPQSQPSYLIFSKGSIGVPEIKALVKALHVTV